MLRAVTNPPVPVGYRKVRVLKAQASRFVSLVIANSESTGQRVVIKRFVDQDETLRPERARFGREISLLQTVNHARMIRILDSNYDQYGPWFATEYYPHGDLTALFKRQKGLLPLTRVLAIADQMLDALDALHNTELPPNYRHPTDPRTARGLVHRDIKPGNVLLVDKKAAKIKIADFGLARVFELAGHSGITGARAVGGTPEFAPRVLSSDFLHARPAVDVWSTVATLFYLLTGETPRHFPPGLETIEKWDVVKKSSPRPVESLRPGLPSAIVKFINAGLREGTRPRFRSASSLRNKLHQTARALGIDIPAIA